MLMRREPLILFVNCFICLSIFQVQDLAKVSLDKPIKVFINENTDVAFGLRQEFIRIRPTREGDREAIVTGKIAFSTFFFFLFYEISIILRSNLMQL